MFRAFDEPPEKRPALLMLAYCLMGLMALSDLYTTASIAADVIRRHYFLGFPVWFSKTALWACWSCLLLGITLFALRTGLKTALALTITGFVSAIALLIYDVRHPVGPGSADSVGFAATYDLLFVLALSCSVYVYHREKSLRIDAA